MTWGQHRTSIDFFSCSNAASPEFIEPIGHVSLPMGDSGLVERPGVGPTYNSSYRGIFGGLVTIKGYCNSDNNLDSAKIQKGDGVLQNVRAYLKIWYQNAKIIGLTTLCIKHLLKKRDLK